MQLNLAVEFSLCKEAGKIHSQRDRSTEFRLIQTHLRPTFVEQPTTRRDSKAYTRISLRLMAVSCPELQTDASRIPRTGRTGK